MPLAARLGDSTNHGGAIAGPGVATVLIENMPAAAAMDMHVCTIPQPHPPSTFSVGSATVLIGGRQALRMGDVAGCGAQIITSAGTVVIGG
jgi:uncharacterized Zn-binding protein involved in type VI secretion